MPRSSAAGAGVRALALAAAGADMEATRGGGLAPLPLLACAELSYGAVCGQLAACSDLRCTSVFVPRHPPALAHSRVPAPRAARRPLYPCLCAQQALIGAGADVDKLLADGATALSVAAAAGPTECVDL